MSAISSCDDGVRSPSYSSISSINNSYDRVCTPPTSVYYEASSSSGEIAATTILNPLSIYDVNSIRRVQIHLFHFIDGSTDLPPEIPALQDVEIPVFEKIKALVLGNPENHLFHKICQKFSAACDCTDRGVLNAADDFNLLCLPGVQKPCIEKSNEYEVVRRLVEMMEDAGKFEYDNVEEVNAGMSAVSGVGEASITGWVAVNQEDGESQRPLRSIEGGEETLVQAPAFGAYDINSSKLAAAYAESGNGTLANQYTTPYNHDGLLRQRLVLRISNKRKCAIKEPAFQYASEDDVEDEKDDEFHDESELDEEEEVSELLVRITPRWSKL